MVVVPVAGTIYNVAVRGDDLYIEPPPHKNLRRVIAELCQRGFIRRRYVVYYFRGARWKTARLKQVDDPTPYLAVKTLSVYAVEGCRPEVYKRKREETFATIKLPTPVVALVKSPIVVYTVATGVKQHVLFNTHFFPINND